jgi:hypothetical protein
MNDIFFVGNISLSLDKDFIIGLCSIVSIVY